ncbi:MAG: SapC family protein [Desulfobacteraceae bacterium]|nr:SapC family protein [Desulfobacteraceae bacterium]
MPKQSAFYEEAIPISKERHTDLAVKVGSDYRFAKNVNSVPLTAVEFRHAAAEYAIVFLGGAEAIMPVVVLSVVQDQNSYVDEKGQWTAKYVPAFVRRYPFVLAGRDDDAGFILCIDETFTGCNLEGRGERLFDGEGERTQYLESVLRFQQDYQANFNATRVFCRKLKDLDILEPMQVKFTTPKGKQYMLSGFMAVNRAKLKALPDDKLTELVRSDELELAYLHLNSMRNLEAMGRNLQEKADSTEAGTPKDTAVADVSAESAGAITQKAKAGVKKKKERDTPKKVRKRTVSDKKLNVSEDITIG